VTDNITWPQRCCEAVRSAFLATAWLLVYEVVNLQWKLRSILQCIRYISTCAYITTSKYL